MILHSIPWIKIETRTELFHHRSPTNLLSCSFMLSISISSSSTSSALHYARRMIARCKVYRPRREDLSSLSSSVTALPRDENTKKNLISLSLFVLLWSLWCAVQLLQVRMRRLVVGKQLRDMQPRYGQPLNRHWRRFKQQELTSESERSRRLKALRFESRNQPRQCSTFVQTIISVYQITNSWSAQVCEGGTFDH